VVPVRRERSKTRVGDLAVFGGEPLFSKTLHVGRPNQGPRKLLLSRISAILDRNWLTNNGPVARELEQRLQELLGVKHCALVCNGTVALELAARALDLRGEVIVPAFTFVATAHAFRWQGIRPVFADVDPNTHCIDPESVRRLITQNTSAIVGVHLWGTPCEIASLRSIASEHGIPLMFDAAHALGVEWGGRPIGNFGECEVLSFHATKVMNSFEGGAVVTNRDDVAERVRSLRNFGFAGMDRVEHLGINGKMSEVCAAMGLTSLESFEYFVTRNKERHECYRRALDGIPGLTLREAWHGGRSNYHYVVVMVGPELGMTRDQLMYLLHAEGIRARRYFWPGCHRMEPYRSDPAYRNVALPQTELIAGRILQLPSGAELTSREIEMMGELLRFVCEQSQTICDRWPQEIGQHTAEPGT